jgi:hypothetical protein
MKIYYTGKVGTDYCSILLYGMAGAGKTPILATLPDPIIVSSEPGLLSLKSSNLPYVVARDYRESIDVCKWLAESAETRKYKSVGWDSISACSENILEARKKISRDPRKFSPETTAETMEVVKKALEIPGKHIVMTCKAMINPESKIVEPFAVVPKLGPALPYHFDNVLFLKRWRDAASGAEFTGLMCRENEQAISCRNRLGNLELWEPPDLGALIRKIYGVQ